MNSRQLTLLSVAALAIIAGAVWINVARTPSAEQSVALYPSLKGQLGKVQAVKVFQSGDQVAAELDRSATGWTLKQRHDYPADASKINSLLLSLESAKIREEKTSNAENYKAIGVEDLKAKDATGARVLLVGVEPAANLIVGKSDAMARATYVRRAGEAKSWLIDEQLTVPTDSTAWLHKDLLNIGADRIQEAVIQIAGSKSYSVVKTKRADANFDVTPLPKGRELNSVSAANSAAEMLVNLQLDDVRPLTELAADKSVATTSVHTFDGLIIDIAGYAVDGKQWITAKAKFDESLAKRFQIPAAAPNKDTPAAASTAQIESLKKVQSEVESLNKQLSNWAYAIPSYKYDAIFKPVDQLLKKQADALPKKK